MKNSITYPELLKLITTKSTCISYRLKDGTSVADNGSVRLYGSVAGSVQRMLVIHLKPAMGDKPERGYIRSVTNLGQWNQQEFTRLYDDLNKFYAAVKRAHSKLVKEFTLTTNTL